MFQSAFVTSSGVSLLILIEGHAVTGATIIATAQTLRLLLMTNRTSKEAKEERTDVNLKLVLQEGLWVSQNSER